MVTTARSTPVGLRLDDGFSTKVAFAADPDISLWERSVQWPGIDGGDPIDTKTLENTTWETRAPQQLITLTDGSMTVGYDPAVYPQIIALINVMDWITIHFPDGSTLDFYGFLKSFEPNDLSEGDIPEATCVLSPLNEDGA